MMDLKKCGCAALSLALSVSLLAGCGQNSASQEDGGGGSGGGSMSVNQPEYVYVAEYIPIKGDFSGTLQNVTYINGSIYASGQERYWVEAEPGEDVPPDDPVVIFEAAEREDDAEPASGSDLDPGEETGGYWNYRTAFYKIGLDGSCETIPYQAETESGSSEDGREYYGSSVNNILISGDGTVYVVENLYHNWNDAPEGIEQYSDEYWQYDHYEESYRIHKLGADGAIADTIDLSEFGRNGSESDSYFYINSIQMDDAGYIYFTSDSSLFILNADGTLKTTIQSDNYIQSLYRLPDGGIACYIYDWSGDTPSQKLFPVDVEAGKLGDGVPVMDFYNAVPGGGDYDFYYTSGINFYGYKLETGEREKLLNWLSSDVNPDNMRSAFVLDDGRIVAVSSYWDFSRRSGTARVTYNADDENVINELVILTKTPADQAQRKQILTLATQNLGYNTRSAILDFNKSSDKYRIEVLDYSEYNTGDDYSAGLTKLRTEILTGSMPDILDLNGLQVGQLASKGFLADLYPFLDSDPELSRDDLLSNVLGAYETDGKLYRTLSNFYIYTAMGAASLVGDTPGWTVDEFNAALAELRRSNPEATAMSKNITRDDFFSMLFYLDLDSFVNWNTGETNFDSPGFVKLLEFVNSFPSEFDWENYEWTEEDDDYYRVAHGLQLLAPMGIGDFDAYELRIYNKLFGGQATFVGFPTEYGVGNVLMDAGGASFALSSKCADKDAAWQFLRQFFTEDYQTGGNSWGLPANRNAFDAALQEAMTPQYQTDENGNYILDENGNKIEWDYGTYGWGEFEVPGGPLTRSEADQLLALVDSCTKAMNMDETIFEIVQEGAVPYFEGQRSAEEVAKQIQSKAMIYVNEQR